MAVVFPLLSLLAALLLIGLVLLERRGHRVWGVGWAAGPVTVMAVGLLGTIWGHLEAMEAATAGSPESRITVLSAGMAEGLAHDRHGSLLGGGLLLLAALGAWVGSLLAPEERRPEPGPRRLLIGFLLAVGAVATARGWAEGGLMAAFQAVAVAAPEDKQALLAEGISDSIMPMLAGYGLATVALLSGVVAGLKRWRQLITRKALIGGALVLLLFGSQALARSTTARVLQARAAASSALANPAPGLAPGR